MLFLTPAGGRGLLRRLGLLAGMLLACGGARATDSLTLDEAWRLAESANPVLRAAHAGRDAAEGRLKDASGLLYNNPQLSLDLTRRSVPQVGLPNDRFNEHTFGISQTFEIAGQAGHRREATSRELAAVMANIDEVRQQVRSEVEQRFYRVLVLQRRIETEREALTAIDAAASAVRKRVAVGEDSRLDGNLATVEAERGRNQLSVLGEQLLQAKAELAATLQLPNTALPEASGELRSALPATNLDALLAAARERPLLRALEQREQASRKRLALERAAVYPDITVGLGAGREGPDGAREQFTRLSLSVPLPLFRRNAAGIGQATSELTQAEIERQSVERDVAAQVRVQWSRLESLRARVKGLTDSVMPALDENRRLSATAYRAGEIGLLQLLLVNRQLLDARRDHLDAIGEFIETRIALERTAGWPVARTDTSPEKKP